MLIWAVTALVAAFLLQNMAELRGGGPVLPENARLQWLLPPRAGELAPAAVLIVSVLICAAAVLTAPAQTGWQRAGLAMIAGALAFNALTQGAASMIAGRALPGTLSGLVLMLPAALWVLALLPGARWWAADGIAATPLLLLAVWWGACLLRRAAGRR